MKNKFIIKTTAVLLLAGLCAAMPGDHAYAGGNAGSTSEPEKKYLAVIIDDFGNDSAGTKEMLALNVPVTAAVMPFCATSARDAKDFHEAGKCVILHMPMEPESGKSSWLGKDAITSGLSAEEVKERVSSGFDELKYAVGLNNHMGSKITKNKTLMDAVISVVKERNLLVIDSVTASGSVVGEVADAKGVRHFKRDVFLDGTQNRAQIEKRLLEAGAVAKKRGYAIAIGHVGSEGGVVTAEAIRNVAPQLQKDGVQFVTISELSNLIK